MDEPNQLPDLEVEQSPSPSASSKSVWRWVLVGLLGTLGIVWLALTPPGLLGKLDAIGYAVCHRIDARSYHIGERQVPLCVRCSGMYLGAMLGLVFQFVQGRKGAYPPMKIILIMGLMVVAFGIDGGNSYLHFFPTAPGLYIPQNWSRLVTGMGMGLAMSAAIIPAFHQTMWLVYQDESGISSWKQLGLLFSLAAVLALVVLGQSIWAIYLLALISATGVFILLTMIYSMVWVMISKKENTYQNLRQLWVPLAGGALIALLQIGLFDLVRYLWTGTWGGFNL